MLIALISDIHANYQALTAVVKHARQHDSHVAFWCLGDVFGRGPGPVEVWHFLTAIVRPQYWLVGNHDWGLVGLIENFFMPDGSLAGEFGDSADWDAILRQREILSPTSLFGTIQAAIKDMPAMVSPFEGVYLAHGSFGVHKEISTRWECVNEYLAHCYQIGKTWNALKAFVATPTTEPQFVTATGRWTAPGLMIIGHTHQRGLFWLKENCRQDTIEIERWYELPCDPEQPVLVNPGSVGFPREFDDDHCASYALLDWDDRHPRIAFHRVPYDRPTAQQWFDERLLPQKIKSKLSGKCHFAHVNNCPCVKEFS